MPPHTIPYHPMPPPATGPLIVLASAFSARATAAVKSSYNIWRSGTWEVTPQSRNEVYVAGCGTPQGMPCHTARHGMSPAGAVASPSPAQHCLGRVQGLFHLRVLLQRQFRSSVPAVHHRRLTQPSLTTPPAFLACNRACHPPLASAIAPILPPHPGL